MVPQRPGPNSHGPLMKREKCVRAMPHRTRDRSYRRNTTDPPEERTRLMQTFSRRKAAVAATAALALVPASAYAATIQGGPSSERLRGTQAADWLNGGVGNDNISGDANNTGDRTSFDRIFGAAGDDTLHGGDSRDRIFGGSGNDTSYGENGNDRMAGGAGNDLQIGGPGDDTIFANLGQDVTQGGDGNDDLWALARGDVTPGPGGAVDQAGDTLDGGGGNDTFHTRDGEVDRITCGPGVDTALLDRVDVITDAPACLAAGAGGPRSAHDGDGRQHRGADRRDDHRGGQERDRPALGRAFRVA